MSRSRSNRLAGGSALLAATSVVMMSAAQAATPPPLDPTTIPKYVTPLVIPPVMKDTGQTNDYDIAVRQFKQQILPGGIWNTLSGRTDKFPATTVWSYGPDADPTPAVAPDPNSQFNYPAYTMENTAGATTKVDWMNQLVRDPDGCKAAPNSGACNYLSHLTPVDRTLHWANPEQLTCTNPGKTKDCRPDPANGKILQLPYDGPVPIVTHVHGGHVGAESDGFPEAWWLPNANNIPPGYATTGTLVNQYGTTTNDPDRPGVASFTYPNDQPSTTLWYHDHTLGMTRNNVYAGPAGFWLIREPGGGETGLPSGTLPGPAPAAGQKVLDLNVPGNPVRAAVREIPIVIQDRSFRVDGSLFYPGNRAFFEGVRPSRLKIPFIGDPTAPSDIAPIWNPEAFFGVMVVNGVSWPTLDVEPDLYRFRLLNGCNSRFLNLALFVVNPDGSLGEELPFYQIGAEQSLLPKVVQISTGFKTGLPGDGTVPSPTAAASPDEALLMGLAERADVLVDFSGLPPGTTVRLVNTAPDAPFGGFPDIPADPNTTGQVMQFTVIADNTEVGEGFTAPEDLVLSLPDAGDPATGGYQTTVRDLALLEEESALVCASVRPNGTIVYDRRAVPDPDEPETCIDPATGALAGSVPFGPKAAVLGVSGADGGAATMWADPIVTNPGLDDTETWELWNRTADAHPIHLHLVKFKVLERREIGVNAGDGRSPEPTEAGWKDTVIAYPGEVTSVNATFDTEGLYVWHCHIVEHEDNEMMVPYCVGDRETAPGCSVVP